MSKIIAKTLVIIIIFELFSLKSFCQKSYEIDEITIKATRNTFYEIAQKFIADSLLLAQHSNSSISEILAIASPILIKSYGSSGSLSSISLRGLGANKTSIIWNGFPLNSLSTGDSDLSLFSSNFFQEIKITPGASSSLNGSGTFGGIVELNNNFNKANQNVGISTEIGSFGNKKYNANAEFSNKKLAYKLSYSRNNSLNNFTFIDNTKIEEIVEERKHNANYFQGLIQNFKLNFKKNIAIETSLWLQEKEKEIPEPAGSYGSSYKLQSDSSLKAYVKIIKSASTYKLSLGSAYFYDFLHYTDKISEISNEYSVNSEIISQRFLNFINFRKYISKKIIIDLGTNFKFYKVDTKNYSQPFAEHEGNIHLSGKFSTKKIDFNTNLSLEYSKNIRPKPIADISISFPLLKNKLTINGSVSNKYRRATFNEKYWQPGGNINILDETGYTAEIFTEYQLLNKNKHVLNINNTVYSAIIENMIQWIPIDGVWTATNNKKVISRGLESSLYYLYSKNKFKYKVNLHYNFISNINSEVYTENVQTSGTQLVYVPKNSFKLYVSSIYKTTGISISGNYTGSRFTTQDNNPIYELSPNFITNIYIFHSKSINNFNLNFSFKINNVLNENYESVKSYPMPGRMYFIGLGINYKILTRKTSQAYK